MALNMKALSRFVTSDRGSTKQANAYFYSTPDAVATVTAAGYFDAAAKPNNLKKGDRIIGSAVVDGTPVKLDLIVTNVVDTAVTVA